MGSLAGNDNGFVDLPLLLVAPPEQPLRMLIRNSVVGVFPQRETRPTNPELRADGRERSQSADQ
jgi:hypothetical protein